MTWKLVDHFFSACSRGRNRGPQQVQEPSRALGHGGERMHRSQSPHARAFSDLKEPSCTAPTAYNTPSYVPSHSSPTVKPLEESDQAEDRVTMTKNNKHQDKLHSAQQQLLEARREVTRLKTQLAAAEEAHKVSANEVEEVQFKAEALLQQERTRITDLQAELQDAKNKANQSEQDMQLLEERLSDAQHQLDAVEAELRECKDGWQGIKPGTAQAASPTLHFEIGLGVVEQHQSMESLALHAQNLALSATQQGSGWWCNLEYVSKYLTGTSFWKQLLQEPHLLPPRHCADARVSISQHFLINEVLTAAYLARLPKHADLIGLSGQLLQDLPQHDAQAVRAALHQAEAAVRRALYSALHQLQQPAAAGHCLPGLRHRLDEMRAQVNGATNMALQFQHPYHRPVLALKALVHAALQVVLMLQSQEVHTPLRIFHHELVGQTFDDALMEAPVKQIPWAGHDTVVLACVRPGIKTVGTANTASQVLFKSQVVVLVPHAMTQTQTYLSLHALAPSAPMPAEQSTAADARSSHEQQKQTTPYALPSAEEQQVLQQELPQQQKQQQAPQQQHARSQPVAQQQDTQQQRLKGAQCYPQHPCQNLSAAAPAAAVVTPKPSPQQLPQPQAPLPPQPPPLQRLQLDWIVLEPDLDTPAQGSAAFPQTAAAPFGLWPTVSNHQAANTCQDPPTIPQGSYAAAVNSDARSKGTWHGKMGA